MKVATLELTDDGFVERRDPSARTMGPSRFALSSVMLPWKGSTTIASFDRNALHPDDPSGLGSAAGLGGIGTALDEAQCL